MLFDRRKKLLRAISKQQARGIVSGDICPCCGREVMLGGGKDQFLDKVQVYICSQCYVDLAMSDFSGRQDFSYDSWAAFNGGQIVQNGQWVPPARQVKREVVPRFLAGDRAYDIKSDWPCTVIEPLPQGLYEVQPDGIDKDTIILKDSEVVFFVEDTLSMDSYVALLTARIPLNSLVCITKIFSTPGDSHSNHMGTVVGVTDDGGLQVRSTDDPEVFTLYPDTDLFQLMGDPIPARPVSAEEIEEIQIEF